MTTSSDLARRSYRCHHCNSNVISIVDVLQGWNLWWVVDVGPMVTMAVDAAYRHLVGTSRNCIATSFRVALGNAFPYERFFQTGFTAIIVVVEANMGFGQILAWRSTWYFTRSYHYCCWWCCCDRCRPQGCAGAAIQSTAASIATPAALSAVDAFFQTIEATATTQYKTKYP